MVAATIEDVAEMYIDQFCADNSCFQAYATAFDFGVIGQADRYAFTTSQISDTFTRVTGTAQSGFVFDEMLLSTSVPGTDNVVDSLSKTLLGFMYYSTSVSSPSALGLIGSSLMFLGYMAYRRKKA